MKNFFKMVGCEELAKGSPRRGRCRDSILFPDVIVFVINQGGVDIFH